MKIVHVIVIISLFFTTSCSEKELPSINIIKESGIGWTVKEPCKIIYTEKHNEIESNAKIKCRGGMSSRYNKHSFSFELNKKIGLGNLSSDDDWILNASYVDKTFMRHKINYDLFRQMSSKNIASKSSYINLYINDIYQGLYIVMEEINASMIELEKSDSLAMLFKDPPVFFHDRLPYVQDSLNYYQQKYPKINNSDKTYYIEKFKEFLFKADDSTFARNISDWIDVDNIMDWHIILLFSNNGDGIMKNFYLYKLNSRTPFRMAIWDYDHAFGRDGDNELHLAEKELNWKRSILLRRLYEIPETEYANKLKKRWNMLRNNNVVSLRNFEKNIQKNDKVIHKEVKKNFELWPIDSKWYYDDNNYNQEVDLMIEFVKVRLEYLDKYINGL